MSSIIKRGISPTSEHFFTLNMETKILTLWSNPLSNQNVVKQMENVISAGFGCGGFLYVAVFVRKIQKWSTMDLSACVNEWEMEAPQAIYLSRECALFRKTWLGKGLGHLSDGVESPAYMLPKNFIHEESLKRLDSATRLSFSDDGKKVVWLAKRQISIQEIHPIDSCMYWTLVSDCMDYWETAGHLASVLLSPDGARVAIVFALTLFIAPTSTEQEFDKGLTSLEIFPSGHALTALALRAKSKVVCAAFHPGGRYLALGCNTGIVILVDALIVKEVHRWEKTSYKTTEIIWSPCGKWLILGDGEVIEPVEVFLASGEVNPSLCSPPGCDGSRDSI